MIRKLFKYISILLVLAIAALFIWGYAGDIPAKELRAKYANEESEFVDLGGGLTVHLRDEGPKDAPAIILLHGSNASLHTWQEWVKRLSAKYRVISYDQPGHGLTGPHPEHCYSAKCFTDVVNQVAVNRGLGKFILGGNSMGGWVSWEYAKTYPGKLNGLVLVDASGAPHAQPRDLPIGFRIMQTPVINQISTFITPRSVIEKSLHASVSKADYIDDAEIDQYWELQRYPGNRDATLERFTSYGDRDNAPVPDAVKALPSLIIWGDEDKLVPVSSAAWFQKQLPNNTVHIYKGVGHIPMQEVAGKSASDIMAWMDKLSKPTGAE